MHRIVDDRVENPKTGTTGRYLVLFREPESDAGFQFLEGLGLRTTRIHEPPSEGEGVAEVYTTIGVAVVNAPPDQTMEVFNAAKAEPAILAVEPERYVSVVQEPAEDSPTAFAAREEFTWGLEAIGVARTSSQGSGARVAILDTGIEEDHPDHRGRIARGRSFVPGQSVHDGNGHGTHCAGTACGPARPVGGPRYGVACEAELYVGKVLSNSGSGRDSWILAGIEWALDEGCNVISMSLGAEVEVGDPYSQVYELVAQRADARGVLIVAAAGNESGRPHSIIPVGHPANCPSIVAVAAVNPNLRVAPFSNGGVNPNASGVDIAAPGVAVHSSWPPGRYRRLNGTSMATPHVAGVCALFAEVNPGVGGRALANLVLGAARALSDPERDVGRGLVEAP